MPLLCAPRCPLRRTTGRTLGYLTCYALRFAPANLRQLRSCSRAVMAAEATEQNRGQPARGGLSRSCISASEAPNHWWIATQQEPNDPRRRLLRFGA